MRITIDTDEPCDGSLPVTRSEFRALEDLVAKTIDDLNALKADYDAFKVRVLADRDNFLAQLAAVQEKVTLLEGQVGESSPEVAALFTELRADINGLDIDPSFPPSEEPPVEPAP